MATRTIQFLGQGFGPGADEITITVDGVTVFSGPIPTVNQALPTLPSHEVDLAQVLFTIDVDTSFSGYIPMTCAVTSGTVVFAQVMANYVSILNPAMTSEQVSVMTNPASTREEKLAIMIAVANPPFTPVEIAVLEDSATPSSEHLAIIKSHNASVNISSGSGTYAPYTNGDPRDNVTINGVDPSVIPYRDEFPGTLWWPISVGNTLEYNLEVTAAVM
jgi:hypothetical protein